MPIFVLRRPRQRRPLAAGGAGAVVLDNPRINVTAVKRMEIRQLQLSGGARSGGQEVG